MGGKQVEIRQRLQTGFSIFAGISDRMDKQIIIRIIEFSFEEANLKEAHPNSAELELEGISGRSLTVVGESLGGSRINIAKVDGIEANFSGSYPTLVVHNDDQPGHVADVTAMLAHKSINIATMQLYRAARGGMAVMVIECDQEIPEEGLVWLRRQEGIRKVTYLSLR